MSDGKRPGGLTALGVINFVFSAGSALGIVGSILLLVGAPFLHKMVDKQRDEVQKLEAAEDSSPDEIKRAQKNLKGAEKAVGDLDKGIEAAGGPTWIMVDIFASVLFAVLLIVSGIGYLKQKRVMGRRVGSMYGIVGVLYYLAFVVVVGMQFMILIGLIYPVLTLALLNTTFKDDFVN